MKMNRLHGIDPELAALLDAELARQRSCLGLISSENHVLPGVLQALGSKANDKYAEGRPGKRFYGGCDQVDAIERLAEARLSALLTPASGEKITVNVQPHSGSQANQAIQYGFLKPGDTFLGLALDNGGHLTHGSPANASGNIYNPVHYHLQADGSIDLDEVRRLAYKHLPKVICVGASAYVRQFPFEEFRAIADEVCALLWADIAHVAGLVVGGAHPNPFPHCHVVTSTTHKTMRGPRGGFVACLSGEHNGIKLGAVMHRAVFPGIQGGPFEHVIAAKAVAFGHHATSAFRTYAADVVASAQRLAEALIARGFELVSGGTDVHHVVMDFRNTHPDLTGKEAVARLQAAGLVTSASTVPGDPRNPMLTSGLRVGTPAFVARGGTVDQAIMVADWFDRVLNRDETNPVRREVEAWCGWHDPYPVVPPLAPTWAPPLADPTDDMGDHACGPHADGIHRTADWAPAPHPADDHVVNGQGEYVGGHDSE